MSFTVAIVGRPNVGKSTLFNRLAGKRLALVDDQPGLTRDRREAVTELGTYAVTLIDTAGLEPGDTGRTKRMREQTEAAIMQADVVLFLIDARAGVDKKQHDIGLHDGRFGLLTHALGQPRIARLEPGGVDQRDRVRPKLGYGLAPVARQARLIVDQRQPLARKPVEQGGLADIRPSDDGNSEGHGSVRSGSWAGAGSPLYSAIS